MARLPERLTTERLVLRTWKVEDAETLATAITESLAHLRPWMPWVAFEPLPIEDRRKLIAEWYREWQAGNDVVLGVFLDGAPIGGCSLHRRIGPDGLEIGYWIHADHIRQGYATELSAALTDLAFTVDGINRVEIHHDQANRASEGVPRTLGYELVGEKRAEIAAPGETGINCVWATTKAGWTAARSVR
jgi:ribosomal-protein-serine acetyltransferase